MVSFPGKKHGPRSSQVKQESRWKELFSSGTGTYSLIAVLIGVVLLFLDSFLEGHTPDARQVGINLLHEFALVLISVFGVSYVYEKLSAKEHFKKFTEILQEAVERGETNAAACEALGILEIFKKRETFLEHHHFSEELKNLKQGDSVRMTGRSLVNALGNWGQFEEMLRAGAKLELCMCDPEQDFPALNKASRYLPEDARSAWRHFDQLFRPWLEREHVPGKVELRFHQVDLMDTLIEIHRNNWHRVAFDMSFGEGIEKRFVLYMDASKPLGASLCFERYEAIWQMARPVYVSQAPGEATKSTSTV